MSYYGKFRITADFEPGEEYHYIRMDGVRGSGLNPVNELKKAGPNDDTEGLAHAVLEQALDRDYSHGFRGCTLLCGISFSGKTLGDRSDVVVL